MKKNKVIPDIFLFQEYFDKYLSPPKLSRPHQEVSSENSFCYHDEDERYSEDTSERYTNY